MLPEQYVRKAVEEYGWILGPRVRPEQYQPASLDLRLGPYAYRLQSSFLPEDDRVMDRLAGSNMGRIDLRSGAILEKRRPYLIPLVEQLRLPKGVRARCNPRSSTGRLDIFTRTISDKSHRFDDIADGYSGQLFLEVVSRSFTIRVRSGLRLNQVRLIASPSRLSDDELLKTQSRNPILHENGVPLPADSVTVSDGLFLSVALEGDRAKRVGYVAKKNSRELDLSKESAYLVEDFWDPVYPEKGNRLILEPEDFYLLISKEGVRIPPEFAAEMTAYDPTSGELRTHYAGFFDPGFGHDPTGRHGTRAVMEVRAHDVAFMIEHGQKVCKLSFEKMYEPPNRLYGPDIGSAYQGQIRTVSRHFRATSVEVRPLPLTDFEASADKGSGVAVSEDQLRMLASDDDSKGAD
ncbi:MAG TPA: 2'-deoxycytidine 5'-triphosphate deaminase [Actinomycetota bacterium]|nr:2'-deoxycytidine 5'-triphosphate deaminase [Actinomycetota bacterium]